MSSEPPETGGRTRRLVLAGAFVFVAGALSATLFYLPLGVGFKPAVVLGVFTTVALFAQTALDEATFGADD